jgi:D-alanyl-D-alanine carboxypeptidase (penicillin-binding protein 5/6)
MPGQFRTYLLSFLLLYTLSISLCAAAPQGAKPLYTTKAEYAVLIDADTEAVLFAAKPDELVPPASMSKLMTVAVIFKELKAGRLTLANVFKVSENAWRKGGGPSRTTSMFAPLGGEVTVDELLQGIIVQSANDGCIIAAEALAGSEEAFAKLMTAEARRIGLTQSTFGNSTGLPHPDQLMTARELGKLALHLIREYPEYYHYFAQKEFKYRKYKFINRNPLIFKFGADGLKTGALEDTGYGLVASAMRNGQRLIAVVNGLKDNRDMRLAAEDLLNWGFDGFQTYRLFEPSAVIGYARVLGGTSSYVPLEGDAKKGAEALLPRYLSSKKVPARIVYTGPLKPPVKKGDQVAYLEIKSHDVVENQIPLYAAADVGQGGLFWRGVDTLLFLAFGWLF